MHDAAACAPNASSPSHSHAITLPAAHHEKLLLHCMNASTACATQVPPTPASHSLLATNTHTHTHTHSRTHTHTAHTLSCTHTLMHTHFHAHTHTSQVPIIQAALLYDIRRGPHSIGSHVRDAAAYVCWAFARAYAPELLAGHVNQFASTLLTVACFDREVNCRRCVRGCGVCVMRAAGVWVWSGWRAVTAGSTAAGACVGAESVSCVPQVCRCGVGGVLQPQGQLLQVRNL